MELNAAEVLEKVWIDAPERAALVLPSSEKEEKARPAAARSLTGDVGYTLRPAYSPDQLPRLSL